MDTQQPSQNSPNVLLSGTTEVGPTPEEKILDEMHALIRSEGVVPEHLVVLILGPSEMVFGEVYDPDRYRASHEPSSFGSIFEAGDFVAVKDPKRLIRLSANNQGNLSFQLAFADFDMIERGTVEFKPQAAFFLSWLSAISQINYCHAFLGWADGKKMASAKAAGIVMPDSSSSISTALRNLRSRMKGM